MSGSWPALSHAPLACRVSPSTSSRPSTRKSWRDSRCWNGRRQAVPWLWWPCYSATSSTWRTWVSGAGRAGAWGGGPERVSGMLMRRRGSKACMGPSQVLRSQPKSSPVHAGSWVGGSWPSLPLSSPSPSFSFPSLPYSFPALPSPQPSLPPSTGTNRALLCKSTVDGLQVTQLNVDHTTENEDELFRLSQLGEETSPGPPQSRMSWRLD